MGMSHVIPELLKKAYFAKEDEKLEVFSVEHRRTFCYISDAVMMIRKLAECKEAEGEAYNIGNETPEVTILEVAKAVIEVVNRPLKIDARPATAGSPARRCPGMKKVYDCIGYHGKVSLKEGISETFDWYRKYVFEGNEVSAK